MLFTLGYILAGVLLYDHLTSERRGESEATNEGGGHIDSDLSCKKWGG